MNYDAQNVCFINNSSLKEQYESFYAKLVELTNTLESQFKKNKELPPIEWTVRLGREVAEIHHNGHTWCFCDFDALINKIRKSKEPTYLGRIGHGRWKVWQDNALQPKEAIIEGTSLLGGVVRVAKLVVVGKIYQAGRIE